MKEGGGGGASPTENLRKDGSFMKHAEMKKFGFKNV